MVEAEKGSRAMEILLNKKWDRNSCEKYRGISLLNTFYKLYARINNCRLTKIADLLLLEEQDVIRKDGVADRAMATLQ